MVKNQFVLDIISKVRQKQADLHLGSIAAPPPEDGYLCEECTKNILAKELEGTFKFTPTVTVTPAPKPKLSAKDIFQGQQAAKVILDKAQTDVVYEFNRSKAPGILSRYRPWLFLFHAEQHLTAQVNPLDEFEGIFEPPAKK